MILGKKLKYLLIILLFSFHASSQEICNNGLDDDNDGLIDLNDNLDCECTGNNLGILGNNFIPNPSFEEHNCLPTDFSQLAINGQGVGGIYCVDNWQPGTWGSSDYFINLTGAFWPNIPTPLPDGQGVAGFFIINRPDVPGFDGQIEDGIYIEYLKTCLTQPLEVGSSYNIQMNLLGIGMSSFGTSLPNIWFGPVDITVFGNTNCTQLPDSTVTCPTISGNWVELGRASYQADGTWQTLNIQFTAINSIQAIMIGGPCSPPEDFTFNEANGYTFEPYFVMDNAALNEINCDLDFIIPNVISPNNDGNNDFFEIQHLPENTEVIILNRWGNVVFSSANYQNNWDGKDISGSELIEGVYTYYYKTLNGKSGHGFVHLVR